MLMGVGDPHRHTMVTTARSEEILLSSWEQQGGLQAARQSFSTMEMCVSLSSAVRPNSVLDERRKKPQK